MNTILEQLGAEHILLALGIAQEQIEKTQWEKALEALAVTVQLIQIQQTKEKPNAGI